MNKIKVTGLKYPKRIIVTAGPTNERLDAVMKITNMSTGALGAIIANEFLEKNDKDIAKLYYLSTKLSRQPAYSPKLQHIVIESTDDLLRELKRLLTTEKIDAVIHSAAVGDYKGKYATTATMLAKEIATAFKEKNISQTELEARITEIIRNPQNIVDDNHKISSYEKDLMFKLDLTPKVISEIKKVSPNTSLYGFKLLDGVPHEELIEVANKLRIKNSADYIIANDLSQIGNGKHPAYFVGENGVDYTCEDKKEIAHTLRKVIFKN